MPEVSDPGPRDSLGVARGETEKDPAMESGPSRSTPSESRGGWVRRSKARRWALKRALWYKSNKKLDTP